MMMLDVETLAPCSRATRLIRKAQSSCLHRDEDGLTVSAACSIVLSLAVNCGPYQLCSNNPRVNSAGYKTVCFTNEMITGDTYCCSVTIFHSHSSHSWPTVSVLMCNDDWDLSTE